MKRSGLRWERGDLIKIEESEQRSCNENSLRTLFIPTES